MNGRCIYVNQYRTEEIERVDLLALIITVTGDERVEHRVEAFHPVPSIFLHRLPLNSRRRCTLLAASVSWPLHVHIPLLVLSYESQTHTRENQIPRCEFDGPTNHLVRMGGIYTSAEPW